LKVKCELINEKADYTAVFEPKKSLNTFGSYSLISYLRFLVFIDDPEHDPIAFLHLAKDNEIKTELTRIKDFPEELKKFKKEDVFKARKLKPVSLDNERRTLQKLAFLALEHLLKFPTTIKKDEELLKGDKLSFTERNCIRYRLSEK
jgi:hypothetical protein